MWYSNIKPKKTNAIVKFAKGNIAHCINGIHEGRKLIFVRHNNYDKGLGLFQAITGEYLYDRIENYTK